MPSTPYFRTVVSAAAFCAALTVTAAMPAFATPTPADFTQIDTNADDVINFSEFAAFAATQDITRTQAAQTFIDLANGDVLITQSEYMLGVRVTEGPTWEQGYNPAPVLADDAPTPVRDRILDITPNEEVAGEVIRRFEDDPFVIDALDDDIVADDTLPSDGI